MKKIMDGSRGDRLSDALKAVAVILFVTSTATLNPFLAKFINAFGVLLFFFAEGFAFERDRFASPKELGRYIGKKVLKLALCFVLYSAVLYIVGLAFTAVGVVPAEEAGLLADPAKSGIAGTMWLLLSLLIAVSLFSCALLAAVSSKRGENLVNAAFFVVSLAFVAALYLKKITFAYNLRIAFLGLPVVFAGYYCRKYLGKLEKYVTWYGAFIAAGLIYAFLLYAGRSFSVDESQSIGFRFIYIVAAVGIYLCAWFAKELAKGQTSEFFAYIGRINIHVLAQFILIFKLLDYGYAELARLSDISELSALPTSNYMPAVLYIAAGVLVPAVLLRIYDACRAILTKHGYVKIRFGKRFFKELLFNTLVCALPIFTALFFSPMEVFLGNPIDFEFVFDDIWWILLVYSLFLSLLISFCLCSMTRKHRWMFTAVTFALGVCGYMQALLLNGKMIAMTGEEAVFPTELMVKNAAVWAAIICAVVALYYIFSIKKKKVSGKMICVYLSCALLVMQAAGLVSLLMNDDEATAKTKNYVFTNDGEFTLSDKNNLIVFILDTCDGSYVEKALSDYPHLFDELTGFTYYPNMSTTYNRTYPAVPYLLSQERCYFEKPYTDYIDSAFKNSSFWKSVTKYSDDIRLFTTNSYVGITAKEDVANMARIDKGTLRSLKLTELISSARDIGMYRSAFYAVKKNYEYAAADINSSIIRGENIDAYEKGDVRFCASVIDDRSIEVDSSIDNAFRFYHLFGPHPGNYLDENCQRVKDPTKSQTLAGEFKMLNSYFEQMKALGIYDNSTIIITADHGNTLSGEHLAREGATAALLLVKPAHADDVPYVTSNAPVCHEDWFATAIEALGGDGEKFGRTFREISEDEARERMYYYVALYSDTDGEVALREYSINGDARVFDNWSLTGRNWNVDYSERAVSKSRLTDEYPDAVILPAP